MTSYIRNHLFSGGNKKRKEVSLVIYRKYTFLGKIKKKSVYSIYKEISYRHIYIGSLGKAKKKSVL